MISFFYHSSLMSLSLFLLSCFDARAVSVSQAHIFLSSPAFLKKTKNLFFCSFLAFFTVCDRDGKKKTHIERERRERERERVGIALISLSLSLFLSLFLSLSSRSVERDTKRDIRRERERERSRKR